MKREGCKEYEWKMVKKWRHNEAINERSCASSYFRCLKTVSGAVFGLDGIFSYVFISGEVWCVFK